MLCFLHEFHINCSRCENPVPNPSKHTENRSSTFYSCSLSNRYKPIIIKQANNHQTSKITWNKPIMLPCNHLISMGGGRRLHQKKNIFSWFLHDKHFFSPLCKSKEKHKTTFFSWRNQKQTIWGGAKNK